MKKALGVVGLAAVVMAACARPVPQPARGIDAAVPVEVTTVRQSESPNTIEVGGTIQGRASAVVSARMLGMVTDVAVLAGTSVRAGQLLVRLDDRDVGAVARQATASAASAEQARVRADGERASAEAAAVLARATASRIATLHARRSATTQELDEATAAQQAADARLSAAQAAVAQASLSLDAARAGGEAASVNASFAHVTAPFDGIVTETFVDRGQLVTPGTPIARVDDTRSYQVVLRVDESRATVVPVGATLDVICDGAQAAVVHKGRVIEVGRATVVDSRTVVVKVALEAGDGVRAGGFARVRLPDGPRTAFMVPASAVRQSGQLSTVFTVESGRARVRLVRLGRTAGRDIEVLAGVANLDVMIVNPPAALRDGAPVTFGAPR